MTSVLWAAAGLALGACWASVVTCLILLFIIL